VNNGGGQYYDDDGDGDGYDGRQGGGHYHDDSKGVIDGTSAMDVDADYGDDDEKRFGVISTLLVPYYHMDSDEDATMAFPTTAVAGRKNVLRKTTRFDFSFKGETPVFSRPQPSPARSAASQRSPVTGAPAGSAARSPGGAPRMPPTPVSPVGHLPRMMPRGILKKPPTPASAQRPSPTRPSCRASFATPSPSSRRDSGTPTPAPVASTTATAPPKPSARKGSYGWNDPVQQKRSIDGVRLAMLTLAASLPREERRVRIPA
jgi:hypothetical protein